MITKKVPGSLDYVVDIKGTLYGHDGKVVTLPEEKGKVKIVLYGKDVIITRKRLTLLSWFECGDIDNLLEHLSKIKFVLPNQKYLRVRCGAVMVFTKPIYYKEGFRYIPNYPRYAIDINGTLLDTKTNMIVTNEKLDNYGYPTHYIRTPDCNKNRAVRKHRLLAHAWLPYNDDFLNKPMINHINGDKEDYTLSNLEWCGAKYNSNHAFDNDLNNCSIKMKVRDKVTGAVKVYQSISKLAGVLGTGLGLSTNMILCKLPGYLWKGRYEIKEISDNSPWFYENVDPDDFNQGKSYYTLTVYDKSTGKERKFNNCRRVVETYNLPNRLSNKIDDLVLYIQGQFPHLDIKYDRNTIQGPYHVVNIVTREMVTLTSIAAISEHTGRTRSEIQLDLRRGKKYIYDNTWLIVVRQSGYDLNDYVNKPIPYKRVEIVDVVTGEVTVANSAKQASKLANINEKTIYKNVNTGTVIKGKLFRALDG